MLVAREEDYFRDPEILRGWIDLKVRSLEKKKYSVVVVNNSHCVYLFIFIGTCVLSCHFK